MCCVILTSFLLCDVISSIGPKISDCDTYLIVMCNCLVLQKWLGYTTGFIGSLEQYMLSQQPAVRNNRTRRSAHYIYSRNGESKRVPDCRNMSLAVSVCVVLINI